MPYLKIVTNRSLNGVERSALANTTSAWTAEQLGKSESYVMTDIRDGQTMSFAGDAAPCAYVELKSLGLSESRTEDLAKGLCALLQGAINVDLARIYIEFSSAQRSMWGWNGKTFR